MSSRENIGELKAIFEKQLSPGQDCSKPKPPAPPAPASKLAKPDSHSTSIIKPSTSQNGKDSKNTSKKPTKQYGSALSQSKTSPVTTGKNSHPAKQSTVHVSLSKHISLGEPGSTGTDASSALASVLKGDSPKNARRPCGNVGGGTTKKPIPPKKPSPSSSPSKSPHHGMRGDGRTRSMDIATKMSVVSDDARLSTNLESSVSDGEDSVTLSSLAVAFKASGRGELIGLERNGHNPENDEECELVCEVSLEGGSCKLPRRLNSRLKSSSALSRSQEELHKIMKKRKEIVSLTCDDVSVFPSQDIPSKKPIALPKTSSPFLLEKARKLRLASEVSDGGTPSHTTAAKQPLMPKPALGGPKPSVGGAKPSIGGTKALGTRKPVGRGKPALPGTKPAVGKTKPALPGAKPAVSSLKPIRNFPPSENRHPPPPPPPNKSPGPSIKVARPQPSPAKTRGIAKLKNAPFSGHVRERSASPDETTSSKASVGGEAKACSSAENKDKEELDATLTVTSQECKDFEETVVRKPDHEWVMVDDAVFAIPSLPSDDGVGSKNTKKLPSPPLKPSNMQQSSPAATEHDKKPLPLANDSVPVAKKALPPLPQLGSKDASSPNVSGSSSKSDFEAPKMVGKVSALMSVFSSPPASTEFEPPKSPGPGGEKGGKSTEKIAPLGSPLIRISPSSFSKTLPGELGI